MGSYKENSGSSRRGRSLGVLNVLERGCLAPVNNSGGNGSGNGYGSAGEDSEDDDSILSRKLLYRKLPQQGLVKLCILKLDGSIFDVNVGRNATVAELKVAIEELFAASPGETNDCISWSHVWGHFCLSYEGQKLVNNKACIRNLGIKDGDQLQFSRHMSVDQSPLKRRFKHQSASFKCLSPRSGHEKQQNAVNYYDMDENKADSSTSGHYEEEEIPFPEFKLTHLLRGWLSYNRMRSVSRKRLEGRNHPSRLTLPCLKG